jgi:hypothetical protein
MAESLNFKIQLEPGVLHSMNKSPYFKVGLDNTVFVEGFCTETNTVEFATELTDGEHVLQIQLTNKDHKRNTLVDQNGKITEDLYLQVKSITIDDIDLGMIISKTQYDLTEPVEFQGNTVTNLPGHLYMSWNGTISLKFTSPFYLWLLENL